MTRSPGPGAEMRAALARHRAGWLRLGAASCVANLLMLAPTLYMLQVYDRVMTSGSAWTLVAVSLVTVALLGLMALVEAWRAGWLVDLGLELEATLSPRVFEASVVDSLDPLARGGARALADLTTLRQFLAGPGVSALFDAPWTPVYIGVLALLHPTLGAMALGFSLLQVGIAAWSHARSVAPATAAAEALQDETVLLRGAARHAETAEVLGMGPALRRHWQQRRARQRDLATAQHDLQQRLGGISRFVRQAQQSMVLALGAWLVIGGDLSAGAMIAASVLMTRALAPVDALVGVWRPAIGARQARDRLAALLDRHLARAGEPLGDEPLGHLWLDAVRASVPGREAPVLDHISLVFEPGTATLVTGPSGAGKSTLARVAVGVWPDTQGEVRLDGRPLGGLDRDARGRHVGYLPQDIELLDGSVAHNIARFGEPDPAQVLAAAQAAGLHELILRLPRGYDTPVGEAGHLLSGGMRQRIGLARAVYGAPRLLVLDEPNAHLDEAGEQALARLVVTLKTQGSTVVMVSHRPALLAVADRVVVLQAGRVRLDGPRDEMPGARAAPRRMPLGPGPVPA